MKTVISITSACVALVACGDGDMSSFNKPGVTNAAPSANSPKISADRKIIGYVGGVDSYPVELRAGLKGTQVTWVAGGQYDVVVLPIDATQSLIDSAFYSSSDQILFFEGEKRPSPDLIKKLTSVPRGYLIRLRKSDSAIRYVYRSNQLDKASADINQDSQRPSALTLSDVKIKSASASYSTINGASVRQYSDSVVYYVDGAAGTFAQITLNIQGVRSICRNEKTDGTAPCSADQGAAEGISTNWTVSTAGVGFDGSKLFSENYKSGVDWDGLDPISYCPDGALCLAASSWHVSIPTNYRIALTVSRFDQDSNMPIFQKYNPGNVVRNSTISYTSGWTVGPNITAGSSPTVGGNASYTNSTSMSQNVQDAELVVGTDIKTNQEATVTWNLNYQYYTFPGYNQYSYSFSDQKQKAFVWSNLYGSDDGMMLTKFSDLSPIMKAYAPQYNILYTVDASDVQKLHSIYIDIGAKVWNFDIQRYGATWSGRDKPGEATTSYDTGGRQLLYVNSWF